MVFQHLGQKWGRIGVGGTNAGDAEPFAGFRSEALFTVCGQEKERDSCAERCGSEAEAALGEDQACVFGHGIEGEGRGAEVQARGCEAFAFG